MACPSGQPLSADCHPAVKAREREAPSRCPPSGLPFVARSHRAHAAPHASRCPVMPPARPAQAPVAKVERPAEQMTCLEPGLLGLPGSMVGGMIGRSFAWMPPMTSRLRSVALNPLFVTCSRAVGVVGSPGMTRLSARRNSAPHWIGLVGLYGGARSGRAAA